MAPTAHPAKMTRSLSQILVLGTATLCLLAPQAHATQNRPHPSDVGPTAPHAFLIQSCGESGSTSGWETDEPEADGIVAGLDCPPRRGRNARLPAALSQTGLWSSDRLGVDGGPVETPEGTAREVVFTAAAGTVISTVRYFRRLSQSADDTWQVYVRLDDSPPVDTCDLSSMSSCSLGGDDWFADDANDGLDRASYREVS